MTYTNFVVDDQNKSYRRGLLSCLGRRPGAGGGGGGSASSAGALPHVSPAPATTKDGGDSGCSADNDGGWWGQPIWHQRGLQAAGPVDAAPVTTAGDGGGRSGAGDDCGRWGRPIRR
uniref:Uncharacterized protein n=1 Tax=Oryza glaberrima TaxID=4538 RepID=A0A679BCD0_ORYGL|nr:hypothetical protein [Oryza glaberrima]